MLAQGKRLLFENISSTLPGTRTAGFFYPSTEPRRNLLQVLVHGVSYDHRYWDAPVIGGRDYSYANFMIARGFDVLALDLPGVGASDAPPEGGFTLKDTAATLSAIIRKMKTEGGPAGEQFSRVASIGHSLGANVAVYAEANWPAADALVVTGAGYFQDRPKTNWKPGEREGLLRRPYADIPADARLKFYHSPQVDPAVVEYDNTRLRTSLPSQLWKDCIAVSTGVVASGAESVRCPVLIQLGEQDPTLPARYGQEEARLYPSASTVIVDALFEIGHCFNLHLNREEGWKSIADYLAD